MAQTPQTQALRNETADAQLLALKVPPHSVEAEQSLLGGLLLDNQAFDRIADIVSGQDFYRDDHRRIYRHIVKLVEAAKPADVVTVSESIEASEDKDKTGGPAYLGALAHQLRVAADVERARGVLRQRPEIGRPAGLVLVLACLDRLRHRHDVGRLGRLDQPRDMAEDAAVVVAVEILRRDQVGDAVESLVVEQQPAQQRLLGLDRMRRDLQRQQLRVLGFVAQRLRLRYLSHEDSMLQKEKGCCQPFS